MVTIVTAGSNYFRWNLCAWPHREGCRTRSRSEPCQSSVKSSRPLTKNQTVSVRDRCCRHLGHRFPAKFPSILNSDWSAYFRYRFSQGLTLVIVDHVIHACFHQSFVGVYKKQSCFEKVVQTLSFRLKFQCYKWSKSVNSVHILPIKLSRMWVSENIVLSDLKYHKLRKS